MWLRLIDESSDRYEAGVGSAGKTSRRSNQGLEDRARTYTNSSQPRGPVPEALRGHAVAPEILLLSESNREGKGLKISIYVIRNVRNVTGQ